MKITFVLQKFPPEAQLNHELYIFSKTNKKHYEDTPIFQKQLKIFNKYKYMYMYVYIYIYIQIYIYIFLLFIYICCGPHILTSYVLLLLYCYVVVKSSQSVVKSSQNVVKSSQSVAKSSQSVVTWLRVSE